MNHISLKSKLDDTYIQSYRRAESIIPVLSYSEDEYVFLCDDQSVGVGFICEPMPGADSNTQERLKSFLNNEYPAKSIMQFTLYRSPDINKKIYDMVGMRDGFQHSLLSKVIQNRANFLLKHTIDKIESKSRRGFYDNGLVHDLKLFVTFKMPISGNIPNDDETFTINDLRVKIESGLQSVGLRPMPMTAKHYIRIMGTMLNWGADASWRHENDGWDLTRPICEQILDYENDIQVEKGMIRLGSQYVKTLSAKKLPDIAYFGDAITAVGDLSGQNRSVKENYMAVTNVYFPDTESTKNTLERKRQFTVNQAFGPMLKFVPVLADKKESFDILYDSLKEGSRPIQISYSLIIFAPTEKRAQAAATAAKGIWRESRFELMEDKFIKLPVLINNLPLCTDRTAVNDLKRYKTMTTEQAAVVLPLFGEWKGTGTFHASLTSRNGQLMSLSLHDSDTNKNLVVAAESGSGKSFLINDLVFAYLSEGAQVWIIDAGKSYQKLTELLNGDFVHFEEGTNICLNPFELVENYEQEEDAIVNMVSSMASAKGKLDEWQTSALKQVMAGLWVEHGRNLKSDHIAAKCLESDDQRLRDIGMQLYPFTSEGNYGRYFAGKNNVNFQKQLTVLELDELQGRKHLRQVVLLQLIYQIQQEVFLGDRNRKKIVIIDEAWDLLKEGEVATFMEHAYRKFRKYGGSVVIATQSVNDLYENAVGRAIAENSSSMYLLGQNEESVESVKRSGRLSMSDSLFNTLKTVHTILGVYSEIFIKSKSGIGVGRLIVSNFQKLLYSTDPVDVNDIQQYTKQGLEIADAIQSVMRDRGLQ